MFAKFLRYTIYNMFSVEVNVDSRLDPSLADGESYKITISELGFAPLSDYAKN